MLRSKKSKVIAGSIVAVLILVIVIVVLLLKRDTTNYYKLWNSIMSNELGTYRFSLDVRTSEHKEGVSVSLGDSTLGNEEEETEAKTDWQLKEDNQSSWTGSDGAKEVMWDYPNYRVVVEGVTTSTEPFTTDFSISLTTENFNETLTNVTIVDDKIYIDIESLQYWLTNSKDEYLINLGKVLPTNSKYMILNSEDLRIVSRYAESFESDEGYESNALNYYRNFVYTFKYIVQLVQDGIGSTGLSKSDDIYSLNLSGKSANKLLGVVKNATVKRGDIYSSIISGKKSNGLLNDTQYIQKVSEKDNFLAATENFYRGLMTNSSDFDLQVAGTARKYDGGTGGTNIEAELRLAFTVDNTDYDIALTGLRRGKGREIVAPTGSKANVKQEDLFKVIGGILDYLNVSNIELSKQLEVTPDAIVDTLLDKFIIMVNSTDSTNVKLSRLNVDKFIQKYLNYKEDENTLPEDKVNAQLVSDFIESVSSITGNLVLEKEVVKSDELEQFRRVDSHIDNVRVIAEVDDKETNAHLGVFNIILMNEGSNEATIKLRDFSLQTMLGSKYPVNDETILRGYDNTFDTSKLKSDISIPANGFVNVKLYAVFDNGLEYMELWYGDSKLADIVAR